nr:(2Fe-2S)-binding protein [Salinarimonas rosea]
MRLTVNGEAHDLAVDPRATLLDTLRERLRLTGAKKGCEHGSCGACTVLVDGRRVVSCLALAVACDGREVTTIEGLAAGGRLHPLQQAFLDADAFQCGYCTPGQIMSGVGLMAEGRARDDASLRDELSGNLCRCGAYPNILAALRRTTGIEPAPDATRGDDRLRAAAGVDEIARDARDGAGQGGA